MSVWNDAWINALGETMARRHIDVTDETGAPRRVLSLAVPLAVPLAVLSRQVGGLGARVFEMGGASIACRDHLAVGAPFFALRATCEWNRRRTRCSRPVDARRLPTGVPSE